VTNFFLKNSQRKKHQNQTTAHYFDMSFAPLPQQEQQQFLGNPQEDQHPGQLHHRSSVSADSSHKSFEGQPLEISTPDSALDDNEDGVGVSSFPSHHNHHGHGHPPAEHVRSLKLIPLSVLIFYSVSGGPFGMEETVRSAGFFYSIVGFIVMPFVWSVPESIVTAELASTFPEAAGGVAWVEEAFGSTAGWMTGYLGWISGATDSK
jgi:hypothetical protein